MKFDNMTPRECAKIIIDLPTSAERKKALEQVPERYRSLVETHVVIAFNRRLYAAHPKAV